MNSQCNLIVFTDLDGTLIDHHSYRFTAALPAIARIKAVSAGLVLASSKTAPEISRLRAEIGCDDWPAIVENGAGVLPPLVDAVPDDGDYRSIRNILAALPAGLRSCFRGFGDVSTAEIVDMTGLSPEAAALAQMRSFSEPGLWSGGAAELDRFLAALAEHGISAQQGGRFLTLSFGTNKVDQMTKINERYRPAHTIALGDAPNDIAMLEHADHGVIVANPSRPPLPELAHEASGRITRTAEAGPAGWNTAVLHLIKRLGIKQEI